MIKAKSTIENYDILCAKVLQYPPQTENVPSIWIWSFSDHLKPTGNTIVCNREKRDQKNNNKKKR